MAAVGGGADGASSSISTRGRTSSEERPASGSSSWSMFGRLACLACWMRTSTAGPACPCLTIWPASER